MRAYRRMDWSDRLRIEVLYHAGHSYRSVARQTGFSVSSVYAEIQHGLYPHLGAETTRRPLHYSAQIAQDHADFQATSKGSDLKLGHNHAYAQLVAQQLQQGKSPDHIVADLRRAGKWTVSTTTLYRYIDRGYIPGITNRQLPEKSRCRKKQHEPIRAARAPRGLPIDRRPAQINNRSTFGHWEMDSVIGKAEGQRQSVLVLTERMTRFELILRVRAKTMEATVRALEVTLSKFPDGTFRSITVDNGCEFQDCAGMEHDRQGRKRLTVYYCHPYSSWERGSNERNNRIIRRYFPKGRSLAAVTQKDCDRVARAMNAMPRKILDYHTAAELFEQEIAKLQNLQ